MKSMTKKALYPRVFFYGKIIALAKDGDGSMIGLLQAPK
jgi:hypothetical protein